MGLPTEHTALIRRSGYPVAESNTLDEQERELLSRYGYWLEALAKGDLAPVTAEQEQFVEVAHGQAEPHSAFEIAWTKFRRADDSTPPQVGPLEVGDRLTRLDAARAAANAVQDEYSARRVAILDQVRGQLDALDAEFADQFHATGNEAARLEREAREAVLAYGASFRHGRVHAVYSRGRVTWDGKRLAQYMETHPEVGEFRKMGTPSVSLRYTSTPSSDEVNPEQQS